MRWNNISNAGSIKPGQKLKIKPKSWSAAFNA
jgi:LysM repeat protein